MQNTEPPQMAGEPLPETSIGSKLANIFVAPSEVFDEVKTSRPNAANWLVPLTLNIVISIIFTMVIFSQPGIIQQMRQPGEERIQKMVKEGKITQKAADAQAAFIDRLMSPGFLKAMGILQTFFFQPALLFLFAMVFWLIGTFVFRSQLDYMKTVEAVGLASMISMLAKIIAVPLVFITGNLYMNLGPVMLLKSFDRESPLHLVLSALNLPWLWYLAVLSIALARLTGRRLWKAALWPFGLYILWTGFVVALVKIATMFGGK